MFVKLFAIFRVTQTNFLCDFHLTKFYQFFAVPEMVRNNDKHFDKQKSKHFWQITYQTLSNSKKPNRPLRYLKDRFAVLNWTLSNCPGAPPGARTLDPNIKSVVLYQLS